MFSIVWRLIKSNPILTTGKNLLSDSQATVSLELSALSFYRVSSLKSALIGAPQVPKGRSSIS
jgi:hypothetical protein